MESGTILNKKLKTENKNMRNRLCACLPHEAIHWNARDEFIKENLSLNRKHNPMRRPYSLLSGNSFFSFNQLKC